MLVVLTPCVAAQCSCCSRAAECRLSCRSGIDFAMMCLTRASTDPGAAGGVSEAISPLLQRPFRGWLPMPTRSGPLFSDASDNSDAVRSAEKPDSSCGTTGEGSCPTAAEAARGVGSDAAETMLQVSADRPVQPHSLAGTDDDGSLGEHVQHKRTAVMQLPTRKGRG